MNVQKSIQVKRDNIKTDQTKFNSAFEKALAKEDSTNASKGTNKKTNEKKKVNENIDPFNSRKYTEDLGINIKNLFFQILEMSANGKNPMPYIMNNSKNQFLFAVMIIIIGMLLLFFSNLMI